MDIVVKGGSVDSRLSFGPVAGLAEASELGRAVAVTDPGIRRLHGAAFPPCPVVEVEPGEAAKSLAQAERLYAEFLARGLTREGLVLGIGGGSVSDLAGFAASTWLHGVEFRFAPTTLLSMVDASVGGKNGVDFRGVKNLIGTFSQPARVRFDVGFLDTLPEAEFSSGMAEAIKHAIIDGEGHFAYLESLPPARGDLGREALERLVRLSVELKARIVSEDEREAGVRRKLNLGHTIGHAIEAVAGIPHGHAVAAGLAFACRLSVGRGSLDPGIAGRVARLLSAWKLPSTVGEAAEYAAMRDTGDFREAVARILGADKKRSGEDVLFALPEGIGNVSIVRMALSDLTSFVMEAP